MQEAMQSRVGERRDTHEDMLSEMGEAALEVALRDLTKDEVIQLAGEDAEWPKNPETVETIFRQVTVNVRAGSSGKPNMQQEREQWGQLLPQIEKTMKQVRAARRDGQLRHRRRGARAAARDAAPLRRDLDLDAIIPPTEKDKDGKPVAHQQALRSATEKMGQKQPQGAGA
jgi:hypothetical protein